ncbi:MAG: THUMP domain-containing protein [Flavobacteriales bacterium]|nr:THUMP domain-containing protein [Flavobacteriales bacterium]|tara:strand:- start:351 stop:1502 length:1152 start_codon:yes stop_codon:yes gene_type:complete
MIAKTQLGLEEVLAEELKQLGAMDVEVLNRAVSFVGDIGFMYKANLNLRTAIRILKPVFNFTARKDVELYEKALELDWQKYISVDNTIAVNAVVHSDFFNHSHYVALKVKDAIVDYFRNLTKGRRPDVDTKNPDIRINIHVSNDKCTLSLDSSGESLHKRGYRHATNEAPISEVLAAGLILLSDWDRKSDFLDPMCGSGTILIEAAMIACNIPPALHRKKFCFMNWNNFDEPLWDKIKEVSMNKVSDFEGRIIGCDRAFASIRKAQENIKDAMLDDMIEVKRANFVRKPELLPNGGTILFNPPYGERLNVDTHELYTSIGDTFKKNYAGCSAWLITSDMEAVNSIHLKHTRRIKIFNGNLECRFLKYEMYDGSKKLSKQKATE